MKKITITILAITLFISLNAQTYRYTGTIFSSSNISTGIVYATGESLNTPYVDESNTTSTDLQMDIYEPAGDTMTNRPAIIFAHGGGFLNGSRQVDDMQAFCDTFARKGYVTATIDYRQGVQVYSNGDLHYKRAAYRGLQDGRAAVRFLRANAAAYGIDPTKIYWGGNSAGSFIGLNAIYMDSNELPPEISATTYTENYSTYNAPDLGALDIGSNLSENGEPDAVMACWGGVGDTLTLESQNDQNVFLIHGTADLIVPFNSGTPFQLSGVSPVYGSNSINTRLNNIGIPAQKTYFVPGEDHEFYGVNNGNWENGTSGNDYWDTVVVKATDFYHKQFKPYADFTSVINNLNVDFTDVSTNAVSWFWDFGDSDTSSQQNPNHTYPSGGTYNVTLYVENTQANWDTVIKTVDLTSVNIANHENNEFSVYPNPAKDKLYFENGSNTIDRIEISDLSGRRIIENTYTNIPEYIDIDMLRKGIYIVRVFSDNQVFESKFVKE